MVSGAALKDALSNADAKNEALAISRRCEPTTTTAPAQEVLDASIDSVNSLLNTMRLSREISKARRGLTQQGRLSHAEVDLLRSAIVLAGAGLDATLKELVPAHLQRALTENDKARERFIDFAENHLTDTRKLAEAITASVDARDILIRTYSQSLIGSSLQSLEQVEAVCTALGLTDVEFRKALNSRNRLRDMFGTRNRIIHEFDRTPDEYHSRRYHSIESAKEHSRVALETAQAVVDQVALASQGP